MGSCGWTPAAAQVRRGLLPGVDARGRAARAESLGTSRGRPRLSLCRAADAFGRGDMTPLVAPEKRDLGVPDVALGERHIRELDEGRVQRERGNRPGGNAF